MEQNASSKPLPQSLPGAIPPLHAPVSAGPATSQGPHIKTEPDAIGQSGLPTMNGMIPPQSATSQSARERAARELQHRYGAAAAGSVNQLQAQSQGALGIPGQQQQRPQGPQIANGQASHPRHQSRPPMNNTQADGAGDDPMSEWKAEVLRRRQAAERPNGEGGSLLRDQLQMQMLQLEGGGLLRPLDEHGSPRPHALPDLDNTASADSSTVPRAPHAQVDGADDDFKVEDDEDAINSDLDDPDDPIDEEHEGDDAVGQVMLCTYDKVQRVKNKWKCTLKDGILTSGGREYVPDVAPSPQRRRIIANFNRYVFHKAQGEFEW